MYLGFEFRSSFLRYVFILSGFTVPAGPGIDDNICYNVNHFANCLQRVNECYDLCMHKYIHVELLGELCENNNFCTYLSK